jgi:hypothetical protein
MRENSEGADPHARRLSAFETMERLLADRVWSRGTGRTSAMLKKQRRNSDGGLFKGLLGESS